MFCSYSFVFVDMDSYNVHGDVVDQQSLQDSFYNYSDYDCDSYESDTDDISYESDNDTDVNHLDSFYIIYNLSNEFHLDYIYRDDSSDGNSSYNNSDSYDDSLDLANIDCTFRRRRYQGVFFLCFFREYSFVCFFCWENRFRVNYYKTTTH